jgi:glycosyltransferase involved in cell wall biosynthesis
MAKVSLIITTFNRPHLLPRAVESAQRAGQDVEVIVVDDASEDETANVCRTLAGIKYIRLDRNQGVAGARNIGLLECTGDYIAFLDDDDLRLPGSLDHQLALLEDAVEAGFVASAVQLADQESVPTGEVAMPRASSGDLFWQNPRTEPLSLAGFGAGAQVLFFLKSGYSISALRVLTIGICGRV